MLQLPGASLTSVFSRGQVAMRSSSSSQARCTSWFLRGGCVCGGVVAEVVNELVRREARCACCQVHVHAFERQPNKWM